MKKKKVKIFRELIYILGKLYKLTSHYKWFFLLAFFFILILEALQLAAEYMFKEIIDFLVAIGSTSSPDKLFWLIAFMVGIYLTQSVFRYINPMVIVRIEIKMQHEMVLKVYKKLLRLSLSYHERENTGSKIRKLNKGVDDMRTVFDRIAWDIGPTVVRIVMSFVLLVFIDYRMALAYFIIVPFFIYSTIIVNQKAYPMRKKIWKGFETVYGGFGQSMYNIKTVQSYVQEDREEKQSKQGVWSIMKEQFRYISYRFGFDFIRGNLITIGYTVIISVGSYFAYRGEITPGELVLFLTVAGSSYYSLYSFSRVVDVVMEAKVGVERVFDVLNSDEEVIEIENALETELKGSIEFKNVYFDYGEGNVLKNINFKIEPGEVVALVGPSGGGKTTIAKLLYRYFDVTKGKILFDNHRLKDLDLASFRSQLAIVDQDIDIFNSSVRDNIAYGKPNATLSEVKKAARIANAHEFIEKFEKGYSTIVGERGIKLSGGQKQRVGIARAILVNPKLLILDEATSSLDAASEKLIQDAIGKVIKDRTTIIIAHRLSTVRNADKIIVIEKGKIKEVGTHDKLLKKKGIYADLVKLQISGYLD
ncbi:ABC transporter ATP-binding protein [Candidatus Falkowbacteria bacterium]|jgi:ABC-type multidrug transport system fused ATPase/permease subunit|nr:ABC transporter ATP-binding protein [Candidatus Falkowbacteria bacterium]MBT7007413.1 ABC transporter ATP-binding protein [Candidatus Falkowbacteria bacterium]